MHSAFFGKGRHMGSRERWVGLFFFVGLALLAYLTFLIDDEGHIFRGQYDRQYRTRLPDTAQIGVGSLVRMGGLKAGKVDKTEIVPVGDHYEVEITFSIAQPFVVKQDSEARLEMATLLQGMYLAVTMGTPSSPPLEPGSLVKTGKSTDLMGTLAKVGNVLDGLGDGGLGRMLLGAGGYEKIGKVLDTLAQDGGLGRWVLGEGAQKNLEPAIAELRKAVENVRKGTEGRGTVARLLHDESLGEKFDGVVADLREGLKGIRKFASDISEGKGVIARLASDEVLGEKLDGIVTDIRAVAADLRGGKSLLARLVSDEKMGQELREAVSNLSAFAAGLGKGEGTIARLVNDPQLYVEAQKLLFQAREAVEDAREAAPISSFASILLGALQ